MQITLVESEIKQALKNYINEQVNVKPGMEITVDIKATRGAEGNTAIIDIIKAEPAPVVSKPSGARVIPQAKEEPKPVETVKEDPPFVPDAKETPAQASAPESSASTDGAAAETSNAANASAEEAPAKPSKPSLFANLGK